MTKQKKMIIAGAIVASIAVVGLVWGVLTDFSFFQKEYPVQINRIDFNQAPTSVVSLSPFITDVLVYGGYTEQILAVSDYCKIEQEKPRVGSAQSPNIGQIIALKPEILLTQTALPNPQRTEIENQGIIVVVMPNPVEEEEMRQTYYDLFSIFEGRKTGKIKRNETFSYYDKTVKTIAKQITPPASQTFAIIGSGGLVSTAETIENTLFSPMLGENVAGAGSTDFVVSHEQVVTANPDILVVKKGTDLAPFAETSAVKNGKVYEIEFIGFEQSKLTEIVKDMEFVAKSVYEPFQTVAEQETPTT